MTLRELVISVGYTVDKNSEKKLEDGVKKVSQTLKKILGTIAVGFSLTKLNAMIEEYTLINNKIKAAVKDSEEWQSVQDKITTAAQNSRVSYSEMATVVTGLMNSHNRLFNSQEKATAFAELMTKSFRNAGLSSKEAATLSNSMTSAFQTGIVSGGQFNSLMTQTPQIVDYLSDSLGISAQQVKALGVSGKITANQLYTALNKNTDLINSRFSEIPLTVSEAITQIKDQFGQWLYQLNEQYKITEKVAKLFLNVFTRFKQVLDKTLKSVEKLADNLGGMDKALTAIGIGAVSVFGGFKIATMAASGQLLTLVKTIGSVISVLAKASPWILLIIALIAATLVAVEDLVNFFQGNDSVVGGLFEKMGVSAEGLKEKISNVVNSIKSILGSLLKLVVQIIGLAAQIIGGALAAAINIVVSVLDKLMPMLQNIIDKIMPVLQSVIESLSKVINDVMGEIMEILAVVLDVVLSLLDSLWVALEPIIDLVVMLLELIAPLLDLLKPIIQILLTLVKAILVPIAEILKVVFNLVGSIISVLVNLLNAILRPIIDILVGVMKAITPIFDVLLALLDGILEPIMSIIKSIMEPLNTIIDTLRETINGVLEPITEILSLLAEILTGILAGAIKTVLKFIQPVIDIVTKLFNVISKVISYITGTVSKNIKKVGQIVMDLVKGPLKNIITMLKNVLSFISGIFTGDWDKVWKSLGNIAIGVVNGIIIGFESMINFFINAINLITSGISSLWTWLGIPAIPEIPKVNLPKIPYLAEGGYVEKDNPMAVVIGDNKNEGEIVSPISKMRETMLDALATFMSRRGAVSNVANTLASDASNRTVIQNVTISNSFDCDSKSVGAVASKAMRNATRDTTSELVHAIAYAR